MKRIIAKILVFVMILSILPANLILVANAQEEDYWCLLASYPLASDASDVSGNGYNGSLVGSDGKFEDGAFVLPTYSGNVFKTNYVDLSSNDELLSSIQKTDKLTITAWVRNDITSSNSNARPTVFAFGSDPENYYAFSTLNWGKARTTFLVNGKEQGGAWGAQDGTSILGDCTGNEASPLGSWYPIAMVLEDTSEGETVQTNLKYYMNGKLLCEATTPSAISALGDLTFAYIGGGVDNGNYKDFQGGIKNVSFYGTALAQEEICEEIGDAIVALVKESLSIPNKDDIRGNITLPVNNDYGATVTWKSSDTEVISDAEIENNGYDNIPAGIVNRQETDREITLTANIAYGTAEVTKDIIVTVAAKPQTKADGDYTGYLMTHFIGEGYKGEQIYFSTSKDGFYWSDLNNGSRVLQSDLGTKGVRDPYILRSPEGDKFYMLATDLCINTGDWSTAQYGGSRSLIIWETTDLVNWSKPRMVEVGIPEAGCVWAPEAIYDEKTGEYIVFWASMVKEDGDTSAKQRIYYSKTRDFITFTRAEKYIERDNHVIDTTIIKAGDYYFRYSKDETTKNIRVDKATQLLNTTFEDVSTTVLGALSNVEGPLIFKLNGEDTYCIMVDQYGTGSGYLPLTTTNMIDYTIVNSYNLGGTLKRHGYVLPVTSEEYTALQNAVWPEWSDDTGEVAEKSEEEQAEPVLSYDFDETLEGTTIADRSGNGYDGKLYGNATYATDSEKGQVLYMDGVTGSYAEFPEDFFTGRNTMTISMDIKPVTVTGDFFTFTFGVNSTNYAFLRTRDTQTRFAISKTSWSDEREVKTTTSSVKNKWMNITLVINKTTLQMYKDGELVATNDNAIKVTELGTDLIGYLGKSFYSADAYFAGYFDNVKIYNRALEENEIVEEAVTIQYKAGTGGTIQGTVTQTVTKGASTSQVTAIANTGYSFVKWSDGSTSASRTDTATADTTYTAEFAKNTIEEKVTIQYKAGTGGTIRGTATQTAVKGTKTSTVTAVANSGYTFVKWSDGSTKASRTDTATSNKTYTATFIKVVTKVTLNKTKLTLGVKETFKLVATPKPSSAVSKKITFNSSKKTVATVGSSSGKITAKKAGTAKITATAPSGVKATCTVIVKKAPSKITLNRSSKTLQRGKKFQIKVILPKNTASNVIAYTSSKKAVATVSSTGLVTAKKKGAATITVKSFNGKKARIKITVK